MDPLADRASCDPVPPHERRLLAPEDGGRVGFDLPEQLVDAAGREIVVAVPAAVAVGSVVAASGPAASVTFYWRQGRCLAAVFTVSSPAASHARAGHPFSEEERMR